MAQSRDQASRDPGQSAKDDREPPAPAPAPKAASALPEGTGPLEYRRDENMHLARAGRVVKGNFVARILGRPVRVYYGAPESKLPEPVRKALAEKGIEVGIITLEELGLKPRTPSFINLTQQQG